MRASLPALASSLLLASGAGAAIVGTTGAAALIATPADARLDVITSNSQGS